MRSDLLGPETENLLGLWFGVPCVKSVRLQRRDQRMRESWAVAAACSSKVCGAFPGYNRIDSRSVHVSVSFTVVTQVTCRGFFS